MRWLVGAVIAAAVIIIGVVVYQEVTEPESGRITGKEYHAEWWSSSCTTVNKIPVCTPVHHPACYEIEYVDGGAEGDACITPAEYDRLKVGDWYGSDNS